MNPSLYLLLLLLLTAWAAGWQWFIRRRQSADLAALAGEWRMNYSDGDPLRLTQRIAGAFPVAGAAHITITDLIYGLEREQYRYYLATEFTVGLTRSKKRIRRVVTFTEPRAGEHRGFSTMLVAPADLPLVEQFRHLGVEVASLAT